MSSKKIILIGLMGAGKSKVAKILSKQLKIELIDTDSFIEARENRSVNQIFQDKGEDYFRRLENEVLFELAANPKPLIIATGGGLPCFNDNMEHILKIGQSFYLKCSNELLAMRLLQSKKERPLLQQMDAESLLNYLNELMQKREVYYSQASFTVDANKFAKDVAEDILKLQAVE